MHIQTSYYHDLAREFLSTRSTDKSSRTQPSHDNIMTDHTMSLWLGLSELRNKAMHIRVLSITSCTYQLP